jgi:hypothetical protein
MLLESVIHPHPRPSIRRVAKSKTRQLAFGLIPRHGRSHPLRFQLRNFFNTLPRLPKRVALPSRKPARLRSLRLECMKRATSPRKSRFSLVSQEVRISEVAGDYRWMWVARALERSESKEKLIRRVCGP